MINNAIIVDKPLIVKGKIPVLVNESSGVRDSNGELSALFEKYGLDAQIQILDPKQLPSELLRVQRTQPEVLFVGGGDGTIRMAAHMLYKTDTTLGVLPLGTLNHFAKDLGIPASVEDALPALLAGRVDYIDIGSVNGHIFVNNACLGIYPEAVKMRTQFMNRLGISKYMAMGMALVSIFRKLPMYELTLIEGDVAYRTRTPFLFIGNNLYTPDLFAATRRESLTDGLFSLFYAHQTTRLELLGLVLRTLLGILKEAPKMEMKAVREIRIGSRRRSIEAALDGEVFRLNPPLVFRLFPKTLRVILPGYRL